MTMDAQAAEKLFQNLCSHQTQLFESGEGPDTLMSSTRIHDSMQELAKINSLNFLTHESQQGSLYRGQVPTDRQLYASINKKNTQSYLKSLYDSSSLQPSESLTYFKNKLEKEYVNRGGKFQAGIVCKERAFLNGWIDERDVRWLTQILNQQSNIVAWFTTAGTSTEIEDQRIRVGVTANISHQSGYSSPFDNYPLFCGTYQHTAICRLSEDYNTTPDADKYFAFVSIMDARYGHLVHEPDGLFKRVIEALELVKGIKSQNRE